MHKRLAVALVGCLAVAGLSTQAADAAGGDTSGSSVLQPVSDLKPTHGGGSIAAHGYLALHARAYARAKAAANRRAGVGSPTQAASTAPVVTAYPNVSPSLAGTYQSGLTPPDTTGAIGPYRYIETVNTSYAIYDRAGAQLNSGSLSALTGIGGGFFGYALSDPQMMWDPTTQRFYYAALYYDSLTMSDNGIAIGWSTTATPASSSDFCQYHVAFGSGFPDYPKLGDSGDFLVVGYNEFSSGGNTYDGSAFMTVNKPPVGPTCAPTSQFLAYYSGLLHNADGSKAATPVPANLVDHGAGTGYVVANPDLTVAPHSADYLSVYSVTTSGTDRNGIPIPAFSGPRNVAVSSYGIPANAAQSGSSYRLDTLDGRFEAAVAAVDPDHGNTMAIWTAHAVYGGAGAEERWYEVDPGSGSVLQSGTVGGSSLFAWNGAISPDRADNGTTASFGNNMAMSVSTSSTSTYPAIQFVSKAGGGAQTPLNNLVQSGGANIDFSCSSTAPCRWGDYSAASPDPAAGSGSVGRIWLGNQYNLAGGNTSSTVWRTWLFAVTPAVPATGSLSFTTTPQTLVAGSPSAMQVGLSASQVNPVQVTLSSSSTGGQFATDPAAPAASWSPTLSMTITAPATTADFYYKDTRAGSPVLTATASGFTGATQTETVNAAALSTITVSPTTANVTTGGTQVFTASGVDQYGNPVSVSSATWSTTAPGTVSQGGSSTTFTASSTTTGSGDVIATVGVVPGSASVTVTTATAPPAPTNLTATARRNRIALSWRGSSGVTYNVYRSETSQHETLYRSGLTGTSYNDSGVVSGTTYYYKVTAVSSGGESPPSGEASAKAR